MYDSKTPSWYAPPRTGESPKSIPYNDTFVYQPHDLQSPVSSVPAPPGAVTVDGSPLTRYIKTSPDSYQRAMDITYKVGDKVHYSLDKIKNRVWTISSIYGMSYVITTDDTNEIPSGAFIGATTNIVSMNVNKLDISRASPPKEILENYEQDVQNDLGNEASDNNDSEIVGDQEKNAEKKKKISINIE